MSAIFASGTVASVVATLVMRLGLSGTCPGLAAGAAGAAVLAAPGAVQVSLRWTL